MPILVFVVSLLLFQAHLKRLPNGVAAFLIRMFIFPREEMRLSCSAKSEEFLKHFSQLYDRWTWYILSQDNCHFDSHC